MATYRGVIVQGLRWALLASATSMVLVAMALAYWQNFQFDGDDGRNVFMEDRGSGGPATPQALRPRLEDVSSSARDEKQPPVALSFFLQSFDVRTSELVAELSATVDPPAFSAAYYDKPPPEVLTVRLTGLFASTDVPLRRAGDDEDGRARYAAQTVALEAWGDSRAFPSDTFGSNYFVDVEPFVDRSVVVAASQRLSQYSLQASVDSTYVNVLLERRRSEVLWVYCLAFAPLIVFLALVWQGLAHRRATGAVALEIVVGLLALLPLRQVLVPEESPGLTRLDLVLGTEFLLFVAWLAIVVLVLDRSAKGTAIESITKEPVVAPGPSRAQVGVTAADPPGDGTPLESPSPASGAEGHSVVAGSEKILQEGRPIREEEPPRHNEDMQDAEDLPTGSMPLPITGPSRTTPPSHE